jgi:PAS domain S-box-containing protein
LPAAAGGIRTFRLLLRGPDDLTVLGAAAPWEMVQPGRILVVSGGLGALALSWIYTLRRRVTKRTAALETSNQQLKTEIAERHEAQAHLARFKAVAEATSDLVAMAAVDGAMLFLNQAGRRMIGLGPEADVTRLRVSDFYPAEVNRRFAEEGFPAALREGAWNAEVSVLHRDGHEIPVSMVGLILRSPAGQPEFMACVVRDISERKRAEAELLQGLTREKELHELKSRFVSMVSHEFRTPLGIIMASAEILDAYLDRLPPEERRSNLRDITDASRQMSGMMEEVLLLGRVEAGKMTCRPAPLDLAVFCQRLADEVTSATNGRCPIRLALASGLAEARADESLLRHVFTNLLHNAVKYSKDGSPVDWELAAHDSMALFTVRDRGIGIPEPDARQVFQAFHRGRNVGDTPGTGLGMVIVKRCVELHGGRIAFESREGEGTTFLVALPLFGPLPSPNGEHTTQFLRAAVGGRNVHLIP